MNKRKEDLIYVGIDLHKDSHTAVILDCWNTKLGEITFANTPAEFPKLVRKVNTSLALRQAKCRAMYKKSDSDDAEASQSLTCNRVESELTSHTRLQTKSLFPKVPIYDKV